MLITSTAITRSSGTCIPLTVVDLTQRRLTNLEIKKYFYMAKIMNELKSYVFPIENIRSVSLINRSKYSHLFSDSQSI